MIKILMNIVNYRDKSSVFYNIQYFIEFNNIIEKLDLIMNDAFSVNNLSHSKI